MIKIITLTMLFFTINSCSWVGKSKMPNLAFTNIKIPNGTPNFKRGFKDGCSTVLYSRGNGLYRTRYKHEFDANLIDDTEYMFGRKRGYNYCFGYITGNSHLSGGWDKYIMGDGAPFSMGKGSLNSTVIGQPSGSGNNANVFNTWGDTAGGTGGWLSILQSNRANTGGVFGGHIFYGKNSDQMNQFLGF